MRNDELLHYNVKGTNWYTHKYGNWERHAKYANGQPNPETANIKAPRDVRKKDIVKTIKEEVRKKYDSARGNLNAHADAGIQVLARGNTGYKRGAGIWDFDSRNASLESATYTLEPDSIAVGIISAVGFSTLAKAVGYSHPLMAGFIGYFPLEQYNRLKNLKAYNKRYGADLTFKDLDQWTRAEELKRTPFNKKLPESTIMEQKLSKEYVKAYSKGMSKALKWYSARSYAQVKDK